MKLGTDEEKKQAEEQIKQKEEEYKSFLEACQKKLDEYVKQIRVSSRLVDSPACLVTEEHEYSPHLERLLQKGKGGGPKQRRIMELNPNHPIVQKLHDRFKSNAMMQRWATRLNCCLNWPWWRKALRSRTLSG